VSFDTLRSELGLSDDVTFNFEEEGKKKNIGGDELLCDVRKAVGEKWWDRLKEEDREFIIDLIVKEEDDKRIIDSINGKYIAEDNKAQDLLKVHIPEGRAAFSEDALGKLLPYVKDGKRTDEAIDLAYPPENQITKDACDELPAIAPIENHVVMKAMCELSKLVNCILSKYGKPRDIKIEMGRDLNKSKGEKERISREIKKNTERNDRVREELKDLEREYNLQIPGRRENIVRYRLWKETGGTCVYCGTMIHPTRLFGMYPDCEVEHILPKKRSLQTKEYNNLTLCHVKCNHLKDNQMPFEAYADNPEVYQHLLNRVFKSDMPRAKKLRFIRKTLELEGSVKRFLNDARYITRQAQAHLRKLGVKVFGTKGIATALLREQAGFETLLESMAIGKKHEDNRNHCIDAVVVAMTTPDLLRDLARGWEPNPAFGLAEKWGSLRSQIAERLPRISVSYRPRHRISDFFHKATAYALTEEVKKVFKAGRVERVGERAWLCRDKLAYITTKDISDVVKTVGDIETEVPQSASNIKTAIRERLKGLNIDITNNDTEIPWGKMVSEEEKKDAGFAGDNTIRLLLNNRNGKKIPVRKIRIKEPHSYMVLMGGKNGEPYKAYPSENNHHIEIVEYGKNETRGVIVPQIEAARRWAEKQPIVQTKHDKGKFLYSLSRNDMFMVQFDDGKEILHRVEKMSESLIILRPHTYGGVCKDSDKEPLVLRKGPNTLKGYKVRVDRLGGIHHTND
jgi:CRISPR-associated endonuclease Csn1